MKALDLARQLLENPDADVLIQLEDVETCRGIGDPLLIVNQDRQLVVLLSPYGEKGHLRPDPSGEWDCVYHQDVKFA